MFSSERIGKINALEEQHGSTPFVDDAFWQNSSNFIIPHDGNSLFDIEQFKGPFRFDKFGNLLSDNFVVESPEHHEVAYVQIDSPQRDQMPSMTYEESVSGDISDLFFEEDKSQETSNSSQLEKKKHKYSPSDRLYGYARVRLALKSREEWEAMVKNHDPIAIELATKFREDKIRSCQKSRFLKKVKDAPHKAPLFKEKFQCVYDEEEQQRRVLAETKRRQVAENKRKNIDRIVLSLCDDIECFNRTGDTKENIDTSKSKFQEEERILTDFTHADANKEADYILNLAKTLRRDFHDCPLYPGLFPMAERLNEWLLSTRHNKLQVILPRRHPTVAQMRQALKRR